MSGGDETLFFPAIQHHGDRWCWALILSKCWNRVKCFDFPPVPWCHIAVFKCFHGPNKVRCFSECSYLDFWIFYSIRLDELSLHLKGLKDCDGGPTWSSGILFTILDLLTVKVTYCHRQNHFIDFSIFGLAVLIKCTSGKAPWVGSKCWRGNKNSTSNDRRVQ